jgi:hypothetical protein
VRFTSFEVEMPQKGADPGGSRIKRIAIGFGQRANGGSCGPGAKLQAEGVARIEEKHDVREADERTNL